MNIVCDKWQSAVPASQKRLATPITEDYNFESAQVLSGFESGAEHMHQKDTSIKPTSKLSNDPSAGSPTETLLRLLLPLNIRV